MPTNGAPVAKFVSLGTRQVAFDGIETGRKVKVQLATVVDRVDGGHVVSDILEQTINQSLTKAVLHDRFHAGDGHRRYQHGERQRVKTGNVTMGAMYCVGCNGNFGNYRAHGDS